MIINDDILHWAETYEGEPFHAMLLDPPYHLTSIVKRAAKGEPSHTKTFKDMANRSTPHARQLSGFMGQTWDGGDLAFRPETWAALGEHLYPGGFGMAFASSRGWHRMACAIEDAGMILHPSLFLFGWSYLSGFPKATRIDTQVDKTLGTKRTEIERQWTGGQRSGGIMGNNNGTQTRDITAPVTPLAQTWAGHRYGGQALKPALEPIIMFQKPYSGRPVDNIVETGAGTLWIDGGRIPTNGENLARQNGGMEVLSWGGTYGSGDNEAAKRQKDRLQPLGRWPSNLILIHSPHCDTNGCTENCGVRALDEQSGETENGYRINPSTNKTTWFGATDGSHIEGERGYNDSGPASRMFHRADWQYEVAEQLANATPLRYQPKASSTEREVGLDSLETQTRHRVNSGGLENEPRFAPTQVKNIHSTVKPISLTKYLATLLLPPAEYAPRRILIPFCGVASEYIGAMLAGWEETIGIEREANYVEIARERINWWSQWPGWGQTDVDKIQASVENDGQLRMF